MKQQILKFNDSIESIKGIGPKKAAALHLYGLNTVKDLIYIFPIKYQNRNEITPIANAEAEGEYMIKAKLISIKSFYPRRGLAMITASFADETGLIQVRWFNKTYLIRQLIPQKTYWMFGKITLLNGQSCLSNPEIEPAEIERKPDNALTAVYPSKTALSEAKISPLSFRKIIEHLLNTIDWKASFPAEILNSSFAAIVNALKIIHKPKSYEELKKASHTIAFFDQVLFQMGVLKRRENITGTLSLPNCCQANPIEPEFKLPFALTNGQKQALGQIIFDLVPEKNKPPMNRLLQGDVGSGKTLVAFLAMLEYSLKIDLNAQCAFMAPTEILARQHLASFESFFADYAEQAVILTGSMKAGERRIAEAQIQTGQAKYIFGTHALFSEKIEFNNLGLCVIDEQQRFGVNHRRVFVRKGKTPHQLLLSATPIPRTLSLTIFGDMDTSTINELPPGRKPITTLIARSLNKAAELIRREIRDNHQIYFVCPLIEASDEKLNWASVEQTASEITDLIEGIRVECLTGRQAWQEKEETMRRFKNRELDMIIATTVVEVGVDNPNATLMIIENADCFGLSQLHQLRGRVGRGSLESKCILISHSDKECERLRVLASTNDGFALALEDLRLRGPGDLTGTRQSGLSHPCFSHEISPKLIENARKRAYEILSDSTQTVKSWFLEQMQSSFGDDYKTFMEGG